MSVASDYETRKSGESWFRRADSWLDDRGKPAWFVAMVLGFILFWPVGLALLLYMIFGKQMFGRSCHRHSHRFDDSAKLNRRHGFRSSGNTAFDAYKADTLKRLMSEQEQFEAFLERLRAAKDQREFDAFMDERAEAARAGRSDAAEAAEEAEPVEAKA